jgi:hypothetical protein
MELDAWKEIWKDTDREKNTKPGNAEILDMIGRLPRNPIAKMKHTVLVETILIVVLFGGVAIFYFIAFNGNFNSVAWLYIVMTALFGMYYYRKWKLLSEMQCAACQVKSNLQRQVNTLEKYIRFYLIAGTVFVPLIFIFLGVLFYYKFPTGNSIFIFPPIGTTGLKSWVIWLAFISVFTVLLYMANRWYVNRLYSRHVEKLKQLLNQMEE